MESLPVPIRWIWACSVACQLINLILLISRRNFRKLPLFSSYVVLNLSQMGFLLILMLLPGMDQKTFGTLAWVSELVTLFAQAIATTEVLGATLKPYQGIWGLGWRVLALTSGVVVLLVAAATRSNWAYARWFELNRGYHITFATAIIVCLLVLRYYSVIVPAAYKMILGGFCFYSCTEILINTVLPAFSYKVFAEYQTTWQFTTMSSYALIQAMWIVALWKPLPQEDRAAALPSDAVYQRLSPQINNQLRLLDDKLRRLWKSEVRPN